MLKNKDIVRTINCSTENSFTVSWKITNGCNYKCPYCIANSPNLKIDSFEDVKKVAIGIFKALKDVKEPVRLHYVGGEPTLYDLVSLTKIINTRRQINNVNLITNLFRPKKYFLELDDYCKSVDIKLSLLASYHPTEYSDNKDFLDKIKYLNERIKSFRVCFVFNNDNIEKDVINFCKDNDILMNISVERDNNNNKLFISKENLDYLSKLENEQKMSREKVSMAIKAFTRDDKVYAYSSTSSFLTEIEEGGYIPDGKECTAGITTVRVLHDGTLLRAGCNYCQNNLILGNVLNEVILPQKPIICRLNGDSEVKTRFCPMCYKINTMEVEK